MVARVNQSGTVAESMEQFSQLLAGWGKDTLKFYAVLFAIGLSNEQVSKVMGQAIEFAEAYRESPEVIDKVLQIQTSLGYSPEKRIAAAVHGALDVKIKLLQSRDEKLAAATATDLLDRNLGKPMQTVQTLGVNLNVNTDPKELDTRYDQLQERLALLESKKRKLLQGTS